MICLPIILASSSPYRRALLARVGVECRAIAANVDETPFSEESPEALCARLSQAKTDAVASHLRDGLVIGSDQVAVARGRIIGKPGNYEKAAQQLRRLSGQRCTFLTGLNVLNIATNRRYVGMARNVVRFRALTDDEIECYLRFDTPYDCAGSFKSEAAGIGLLQWQRGDDPSALIGLPLIQLTAILRQEEVPLFASSASSSADPAQR